LHLTAESTPHFPDSHAELTVDLLHSIRAVFGSEGIEQVIIERSHRQSETYRSRLAMQSASSWQQQVQLIAQWRSQEGYMAETVEQLDGTLLLIENHCPICTAAHTCQRLCLAELETFKAVFGEAVRVERVEHILQGDRRCAYRIGQQLPSESIDQTADGCKFPVGHSSTEAL
jgi:predicted ArsR family transcriptional regulator